jgi:hypothetical protein
MKKMMALAVIAMSLPLSMRIEAPISRASVSVVDAFDRVSHFIHKISKASYRRFPCVKRTITLDFKISWQSDSKGL